MCLYPHLTHCAYWPITPLTLQLASHEQVTYDFEFEQDCGDNNLNDCLNLAEATHLSVHHDYFPELENLHCKAHSLKQHGRRCCSFPRIIIFLKNICQVISTGYFLISNIIVGQSIELFICLPVWLSYMPEGGGGGGRGIAHLKYQILK